MKRHIQVSRNLRVIYSSKSILAADKIGGREHAEQIASDLLDLFKSHVGKISNKIELKTDVEVTTDNTWKIDLLILYPGAEWWDNSGFSALNRTFSSSCPSNPMFKSE